MSENEVKVIEQSYLEKEAIDLRREQMARSDYGANNEYNDQHPDALATGDEKGKGTGDYAPAKIVVPDMRIDKYQMSGQYNVDFNSGAGNDCDNMSRREMVARSVYGPGKEYGIVDTTLNRAQGQYDGDNPIKLAWQCKV